MALTVDGDFILEFLEECIARISIGDEQNLIPEKLFCNTYGIPAAKNSVDKGRMEVNDVPVADHLMKRCFY